MSSLCDGVSQSRPPATQSPEEQLLTWTRLSRRRGTPRQRFSFRSFLERVS